jgi:protein involved in polysaccharide export with SLBB domain
MVPSLRRPPARSAATLLAAALLTVVMVGCATNGFPVPRTAEPLGALAQTPAVDAPLVQPGDELDITFFDRPELSGKFLIGEDGAIGYPFGGRVHVSGLTADAAATAIRTAIAKVFETPEISVSPLLRINVMGAVQRPGLYSVDPTTTLVDALGMAGGPTADADMSEWVLIRGGQYFVMESSEALAAGDSLPQLIVRSGDLIVVPERPRTWDVVLRYVTAAAGIVNTILILATR